MKLIAIDPCIMEEGKNKGEGVLTIGKEYIVKELFDNGDIEIINNVGENHSFDEDSIPLFFKL